MSFVTGGHTIYLESPTTSSQPHVVRGNGSSEIVFIDIPSGTNLELEEVRGAVIDLNAISGRIIG